MYDRLRKTDPKYLSSKTLAYIGDSVFELYSRLRVVNEHNDKMSGLHKYNITIVNAGAQALGARKVLDKLSEEELAVFKRGRNLNSGTMAKNANAADYRVATGLETLVGYLFMNGSNERLEEILSMVLDEITCSSSDKEKNDA